MGRLGDALEVFFGPDDRFQTVRATVRHWLNWDLAGKLSDKEPPMWGRKRDAPGKESGPPKCSTSTLTIALSRPACARIEERREVKGGIETKLTVTDGNHRWECDSEGHVEISEGEHRQRNQSGFGAIDTNMDRHFNPAQIRLFFQELSLESLGTVRTADRDCVRLRATLRPGASLWPHWLPRGADEYEFHVDPERGTLLNIISRSGGAVFSVYEVLKVAFDEPLESNLFTYETAPGEQVGPKIPVVEHLTLAAAVARMPFTVLVPTRVPDPEHSQFEVMYHPPHRRAGWSHLALMYRGGRGTTTYGCPRAGIPTPVSTSLNGNQLQARGTLRESCASRIRARPAACGSSHSSSREPT